MRAAAKSECVRVCRRTKAFKMLPWVLRVVGEWLAHALVAESALDQLVSVRERSAFVAKTCEMHPVVAALLVGAVGVAKVACVLLRCVPATAGDRRATTITSVAIGLACLVEALVAVVAGDAAYAVSVTLLSLVFVQSFLVCSSSRHLRTSCGIVTSNHTFSDGTTSALRHYATRYRFHAQATWAIGGLLVHAAMCNTSLLASTPLARALARAEARCTAAAIAVVASLGGHDEYRPVGRKKDF